VKKFAKGPSMSTGKLLTSDERGALLTHAKESSWDKMHLLTHLALATGGRRGEIMALRWDDIDLAAQELTFRVGTTKSGKARTIGLASALRMQLLQHRQRDGLVFPSIKNPARPYAFNARWVALREAAGVDCRFHDMRHTCASLIVNSGVPIHIAKVILGHSSVVVTERYLHSDDNAMDQHRDVMDKMKIGG
jgi:integrase